MRQFLWLALLSTPTRYDGSWLWRAFAMVDPNPAFMGFEEGDEERQWNGLRDAVEDHKDKFEDSEVLIKREFTVAELSK